jgi:hypothetical protein
MKVGYLTNDRIHQKGRIEALYLDIGLVGPWSFPIVLRPERSVLLAQ